jgi:hypothetical protein
MVYAIFNTYCIEVLVFIESLPCRKMSIMQNLPPQFVCYIWRVIDRYEGNCVKVIILQLFTVSWRNK